MQDQPTPDCLCSSGGGALTDPRSIVLWQIKKPRGLRHFQHNGSGISWCPVQARIFLVSPCIKIQSQYPVLATCTIAVYTRSDHHPIPDLARFTIHEPTRICWRCIHLLGQGSVLVHSTKTDSCRCDVLQPEVVPINYS